MHISRTVAVVLMLLRCAAVVAQQDGAVLESSSDAAQRLFDGGFPASPDTVWEMAAVEEQPRFPGGMDSVYSYLLGAISYPEDAARNKVHGRVIVEFVVGKDGRVGRVQVRRGLEPSLDAEAARAVASLPRWEAGRMHGKPVAVRITLPIRFTMGQETPEAPWDGSR